MKTTRPPSRFKASRKSSATTNLNSDRFRGKPKADSWQKFAPDRPANRGNEKHTRPGSSGGPYWLYGRHAVIAALANPARQTMRLLTLDTPDDDLSNWIREKPALPHRIADRLEFQRLLPGDAVHQGIALQVQPLEPLDLEDVIRDPSGPSCLMVLDQVTDPHNVGAILRSAAAFGADAIIVTERHAAPENGALAKAASGALERIPIVRIGNLVRGLEQLKQAGYWCAGLAAESASMMSSTPLPDRLVLIMGAEGTGMRRLTRDHCDLQLRLPTLHDFGQLNVSNAAAIALYEYARQHGQGKG